MIFTQPSNNKALFDERAEGEKNDLRIENKTYSARNLFWRKAAIQKNARDGEQTEILVWTTYLHMAFVKEIPH